MPTPDRPDLAEIESFALYLDAWTFAGDAPRSTGSARVSQDLATTARTVAAGSSPRNLTNRFADRLEENLMDLAALERPQLNVPIRRRFQVDLHPTSARALSMPVVVSRRRGRF